MRPGEQAADAAGSFKCPAQVAPACVTHQGRVPVVVPFLDHSHPVVNVVDGLSKYPIASVPRVLGPLPPSSAAIIGECTVKITRHLHADQLVLRVVGEIPLPT